MNNYYLSTDLNDDFIYIATIANNNPNHTWMIRFNDRFYADKLLKKLTAKLIQNPDENNHPYELIEKVNHPKLGELFIYGLTENLMSMIR